MADIPTSVDGIATPVQASDAKPKTDKAPQSVNAMKLVLTGGLGLLYAAYAITCFVLMAVLPDPSGGQQGLQQIGLLLSVAGGLVFLAIGAFGFMRIGSSKAAPQIRTRALLKLAAVALPGIILGVATPVMIMRQPTFALTITKPANPAEFIAPLSVTFSFEEVVNNLKRQGFVPLKYAWDINNDKKVDQETTVPSLTARFDKSGVYAVSMKALGANGTSYAAARRFVISQSVFTVEPSAPLINQPVVFSLSNLLGQKDAVKEIAWDFDNDGKTDETTTTPQVTHTFFRLETVTVTARVMLANNTEATYQRSITVTQPEPLPFPVTLVSEPKNLLGNEPFPALFRIETKTPVAMVEWAFGDGEKAQGQRVAHTFEERGNYVVTAKVHSQSGSIAELSTVVQIVERLNLGNLTFDGSPQPQGASITAEVPLTLNLTPKTSTPFVQFMWEAPDATEVGSTDTTLQATYRREGTYTVTLIAQDAEKKVMRYPITVNVGAPASSVVFAMEPETGVAPLTVKFDASETYVPNETISGFQWKFGDRSEEQFTGARTEHTYEQPGTYVIDVVAKTTSGKDFRASKTLVVREPLVKACVLPSRTMGSAPLGVQFASDCSTGDALEYLWDFGDGAQSDQANPIHVFDAPGAYTTVLTVTDASGAKDSVSVTITVQP